MSATIVFHKQLGDTVLIEPAIRRLALRSGQPVRLLLRPSFEPLTALFDTTGSHDRNASSGPVWALDPGSRTAWRAWRQASSQRTLCVTDPKHVRWLHRFVFDDIRIRRAPGVYRALAYWLAVGGGPESAFIPPRLSSPPEEWRTPDSPAEPYTLIHAGSSLRRKEWPARHWITLLRLMAEHGFPRPILSGGPSEAERSHCAEITSGFPAALNLCGRASLKGFLHLVSRASLVVAVDGAAAHLASAFDLPCLTLFGPTKMEDWHYPGPGRLAVQAPKPANDSKPTMAALDPDVVFGLLKQLKLKT